MLQQGLFVLIFSCHFRQAFVHYLMSILMTCKWTGGYIYQALFGKFPVATTYSEKKKKKKKKFIAANK